MKFAENQNQDDMNRILKPAAAKDCNPPS